MRVLDLKRQAVMARADLAFFTVRVSESAGNQQISKLKRFRNAALMWTLIVAQALGMETLG